ncbi:hypothetical protein NHX12_009285 [Muraenolepis orangiensis]|uniref:Uncharacterized protein n=1 Tax=Muraenolepis orangiensis TaxID=630683 RepID=A0A9Q0IAP4_9TELE|nr:hypothetical protein NHX12_009285 [Muraenolepis orangiensis]
MSSYTRRLQDNNVDNMSSYTRCGQYVLMYPVDCRITTDVLQTHGLHHITRTGTLGVNLSDFLFFLWTSLDCAPKAMIRGSLGPELIDCTKIAEEQGLPFSRTDDVLHKSPA